MRFQWVLQGITCLEDTIRGLQHVKYAQQGVCMGKVKSEDIVYWRYRFTGRETLKI